MVTDQHSNDYIIDFVPAERPFSIAAVLADRPHLATGRVLSDSLVVEIPAPIFRNTVDGDLRSSRSVMQELAALALAQTSQIKALKTRTATERLAAFLCSLADSPPRAAPVNLPCEKRLLAGWLGITPSTLSRAFRQLESLGVRSRGGRVLIESLDSLREFARPTG